MPIESMKSFSESPISLYFGEWKLHLWLPASSNRIGLMVSSQLILQPVVLHVELARKEL